MTKGIDVSSYQPNSKLDWPKLKAAGVDFAVVKYTEGTNYMNPEAFAQVTSARAAGIVTHAYHFFRAYNIGGARAEAVIFAGKLKLCPVDGYAIIDVEATSCNVGKDALTANINAFLDELAQAGFDRLGVYASLDWFRNKFNRDGLRPGVLIWLAQYPTSAAVMLSYADSRKPSDPCDVWQFASSGRVDGYNGNLDVSVDYSGKMTATWPPAVENIRENEEENEMIYNYIDGNMPEWARPTIQKLVNKGLLRGNENGELGLNDTMLKIFVVNDRAGIYGE